jgi:type II secretory pathway pseudopilin PulG
MGVDKGYGSGKPRSAANSASRRTQAAKANLRKENIKRVSAETGKKIKSNALKAALRNAPQIDPAMGLGVSTRVLRGAAAALSAAGNIGRAQMATQRANIAQQGRAASRVIAQAGGARRISDAYPVRSEAANTLRNARTTTRQSSEAYPRSFDAFVGRSPRSVPATQKTPSAQNFYEGGRRYVDTRYTYDPITSPRRTQYDPRTGYATQPKTITGPKPGAALNPTGARYAPPRKVRGGGR